MLYLVLMQSGNNIGLSAFLVPNRDYLWPYVKLQGGEEMEKRDKY